MNRKICLGLNLKMTLEDLVRFKSQNIIQKFLRFEPQNRPQNFCLELNLEVKLKNLFRFSPQK